MPVFMICACHKLDLVPLSEATSETWYSDESELDMSLNYLFQTKFWSSIYFANTNSDDAPNTNPWKGFADDDFTARSTLSIVANGAMNSQTDEVVLTWQYAYNSIAAANTLLDNLQNAVGKVSEVKLKMYAANARFVRATHYAELIFRYGDVPYYTKPLSISEAFALSQTKKEEVLQRIYDDYDSAIVYLPISYSSSEMQYATKGAAMAMKARIALYMGDWATAADASLACINLGVYDLHPDFSNLFLNSTRSSKEFIFTTARSYALKDAFYVKEVLPRYVNGWGNGGPSWDLFCAFLCTDGLPIDKSPLFNPHEPFKNRDPRCNATIVEFGIPWCGAIYQPHPDTLQVWSFTAGTYISNRANRAVDQYCSYNALTLKKYVDKDWYDDLFSDNINIMMRYADVLLMYAEAKIELGDIDQTVIDAINKVRARAYGVDYTQTASYPAVTITNQSELRKTLRIERRMEFAWEGWRYNDLIRWRLADKILNTNMYGILDPIPLRAMVVQPGLWFFPETPTIDENGFPDFTAMYNKGLIKLLAVRRFDAPKNYLWPIPAKEIIINPNIQQNPGY